MKCFFCGNTDNGNATGDSLMYFDCNTCIITQVYFDCNTCISDNKLLKVYTGYRAKVAQFTVIVPKYGYEAEHLILNDKSILYLPSGRIELNGFIFTPKNIKKTIKNFAAFM